MAISLARHMMGALRELRFQPTTKRVRVMAGGSVVADSVDAVLVWEPSRVVPSYAVPERDVRAALRPAPPGDVPEYRSVGFGDGPPLLDPSVPFAVHTAAGEPLTVDVAGTTKTGAAFRLADDDLRDYVELDFGPFDWLEEDEPIVGHPRDPFHRIDVVLSTRPVRIEHDGHVLAESERSRMLFEGTFGFARHYLPADDVRVELRPGTLRTTCAYKGEATHYSAVVDGQELPNIAWSYHDPLDDAARVRDLICFYQERLDLVVDGDRAPRVRTPWS